MDSIAEALKHIEEYNANPRKVFLKLKLNELDQLCEWGYLDSNGELTQDAHLLLKSERARAAAPDLYHACRMAHELLVTLSKQGQPFTSIEHILASALVKADYE